MTTYVESVLSLIEEYERAAREATPGPWEAFACDSGHSQFEMSISVITSETGDTIADLDGLMRLRNERDAKDDGRHDAAHIALNDPAFVLEWCEGVRRIVQLHHPWRYTPQSPEECSTCGPGKRWPCPTIQAVVSMFDGLRFARESKIQIDRWHDTLNALAQQ